MMSKSESDRYERNSEQMRAADRKAAEYYEKRRREGKPAVSWTDWLIGGPIILILFLILATIGSAMFGAI